MNNGEKPNFGLPTKSLQAPSEAWIESYGVTLPRDNPDYEKMLWIPLQDEQFDAFRARPGEIPNRVAAGDAVVGIGCTDGFEEAEIEPGSAVIARKLGFGACNMYVLAPLRDNIRDVRELNGATIATSYPKATERFFDTQGVGLGDIQRVSGGVEAMPYMPATRIDAVVDLVQSGASMRANELGTVAFIERTEAALIENPKLMSRFGGIFERFTERIPILGDSTEQYPRDIPKGIKQLDINLSVDVRMLPEGSGSRKLLEGGVEAISQKIGEESFELVKEFSDGSDEQLIDEAQTLVWLTGLGMRARGDKLGFAVANARLDGSIAKGKDPRNDAVRILGDAQGRFVSDINRKSTSDVRQSAANLLGAVENLLAIREITMGEVYERV